MFNKTIIAVAAAAAIGAASALTPTVASARAGGHAFHGGCHFQGSVFRHGEFRFRGGPVFAYGGYSCWRWVPTRWGYARIWVCLSAGKPGAQVTSYACNIEGDCI